MKHLNLIFGLVLFLIIANTANTQAQSIIEKIEQEVEATVQAENIPAVSIGVLYKNEIHYINRGHFNRQEERKVDEKSIYQIASLGKIFIGIIANNLLLEKKIQLDQPITTLLPSVFSEKRKQQLEKITIEHLLHHQSGLPQDSRITYRRKDGTAYLYDYTEEDLLKDLQKLKIKSGNPYQYSNTGYAILAYLLERATNSTYDELLDKYILKPYNFENTTATLNEAQQKQLVTPYRKDKRTIATAPWRMGKMTPPSGLYSTIEDLSKLLKTQLAAYQDYKKTQQMTPLILTTNKIQKYKQYTVKYGYGFNDWGNETYGHTGDMDGFAGDYSITLGRNTGIVVLTSSGEDWIRPMISRINKILAEAAR
ncbi:MAG: serine hydrolase domain-containing protein [Bacteroidota bacterium]